LKHRKFGLAKSGTYPIPDRKGVTKLRAHCQGVLRYAVLLVRIGFKISVPRAIRCVCLTPASGISPLRLKGVAMVQLDERPETPDEPSPGVPPEVPPLDDPNAEEDDTKNRH
jgi:hypothetical protein